ncbi:MAG: cupin domain-containing protein [Chromatiales bacterium]
MFIKRLVDCPPVTASDGCEVRELLQPKQDPVDLPYSLAVAEVAPGERSYRHRLRQTEVYYLLEGSGVMHIGSEARSVCVGDAVLIPAGAEQWIENPGANRLRFAAIVSPPWRTEDDKRLEESAGL